MHSRNIDRQCIVAISMGKWGSLQMFKIQNHGWWWCLNLKMQVLVGWRWKRGDVSEGCNTVSTLYMHSLGIGLIDDSFTQDSSRRNVDATADRWNNSVFKSKVWKPNIDIFSELVSVVNSRSGWKIVRIWKGAKYFETSSREEWENWRKKWKVSEFRIAEESESDESEKNLN